MTGLTLTGNQLIISILILGFVVLTAIIVLRFILKHKLLNTESTVYTIRRRVKAINVDSLQLRAPILKFAFLIALSFVFFAFSWTIQHAPIEHYKIEDLNNDILEITPPRIKIIEDVPVYKENIKPENPIIIPDLVVDNPIFIKPKLTIAKEPDRFTVGDEVIKNITPPPLPPIIEDHEAPIVIAEQMPRFPGCETLVGSIKEKKACADQKLLEYIYNNIKYPNIAKQNGIEGTVVVRFTVNKKGEIVDINLLRDPGAGLGAAAFSLVESMNTLEALWTPGKQQGRPVSVLYTLPIKFKLK